MRGKLFERLTSNMLRKRAEMFRLLSSYWYLQILHMWSLRHLRLASPLLSWQKGTVDQDLTQGRPTNI
ncbi:hypothetical protein Plhal304r1_c004g0016091 [Plasmopara halstedii]